MVEHRLQKGIIQALVECETARYADLKPKEIDGNTFTYHLHALIRQKFIAKNAEGQYELTNKGKLYGINNSLSKHDALLQAHSIILLAIRDGNRWLLRKRLAQPMYGKIGFIHGEPLAGETIFDSSTRVLKKRTNLSGKFEVRGSGYVLLQNEDEVISYTHFTLLEVTSLEGDFYEADNHGENLWIDSPEFSSDDMIPSMADLVEKLSENGIFFCDLSYRVSK